jgi:acyl-CoA synthetase (AMP-forming)/AMP-acid ligase II
MISDLTARDLLLCGLARGGTREALIDAQRRVSFRDLRDRGVRLGNALVALGCTTDAPAAFLVGNRTEYIELDVAATLAGVPRVGLGERLVPDEWRYMLEDSRAAVLVVSGEFIDRLGDIPDTVRTVIVLNPSGTADDRGVPHLEYEQVIRDASGAMPAFTAAPSGPNFLMYTSGTTGRPKGAVHTNRSRAASALQMLAFELSADTRSTMLHVGPLTHGSGAKVLAFLSVAGRNVIAERFDPELVARLVRDERGTHSFMVPTMLQRLVGSAPDVLATLRDGFHQISFGGSPIAPAVYREAVAQFGPALVQVYGSTEAPHPLTQLKAHDLGVDPDDALLSSAGYVTPAVQVRIVAEDGTECGPGRDGELQVRSAHLMAGYWGKPDATASVFSDDGYYLTGDVAVMDDEGLVTFRDRKRDIIISGGLNIYPSEVERVLIEHPSVSQAAVIGYPDDEWGESVCAFIVTTDGTPLTDAELSDWSRERIAGYKKPRRYEFRDSLPLGSSHKVLRNELREELWQGRERRVN